MTTNDSLQDRFSPENRCFGCGPANEKGLRIKSSVQGEELVAEWTPQKHHEAFDGFLNGGIIGTLMDCHSNWTAAWHLMKKAGATGPPFTVTASLHVRFVRPTPSTAPVHLRSRVAESGDDRATIETEMTSGGKLTATCRATFVAVKEGHPAYRRW